MLEFQKKRFISLSKYKYKSTCNINILKYYILEMKYILYYIYYIYISYNIHRPP